MRSAVAWSASRPAGFAIDDTGDELRTTLGNVGKLGWDEFPGAVRTAYLSITLDSRRIMLTAAEAQLRNPGLPLSSFRQAVESDLAARTAELNRLRSLALCVGTPSTPSGTSSARVCST